MVSGIAVTSDSTVSMPSPTSSVPAVGAPKRTAKPWTRPSALRGRGTGALAGRTGIEPGAVDAGNAAVGAGHGGDQRRQAAHAIFVAMEECGVEAERGEAAAVDRPGARR